MIENAFWTCRSYSWTVGLGLQKAKSTETTRFDVFERKFRYLIHVRVRTHCEKSNVKLLFSKNKDAFQDFRFCVIMTQFILDISEPNTHTHLSSCIPRLRYQESFFRELLPHLDRLLNYFPIIESPYFPSITKRSRSYTKIKNTIMTISYGKQPYWDERYAT